MKTEVELLAPAGSYDGMRAAFAAGADAVYIGGQRFGARAFADNPSEEMLKQAIWYAHLRGKKVYLTVNTLFKPGEPEMLHSFLLPLYEEGLDAVIVQDLGAMQFIGSNFPGMDIHASTQMTVTGRNGAALLKEMGASRVVTARELSLNEIRNIHDNVDIEIESFVHGALCYCYSGQCLFSSIIGGRSGNRGRCAQPCRMTYELREKTGNSTAGKRGYLLSPKDMCTLEILPQILEAGVYSMKIEGRMKRPEYAAGVVRIYRKYIDRYLEHGKTGFCVSREDITELMDLYNRGGFSEGYYRQRGGPGMMSVQRPNHWGTKAAEVISVNRGTWRIKAVENISKGDVLEYRSGVQSIEFTAGKDVHCGEMLECRTAGSIKKAALPAGKHEVIYRTRNTSLLDELNQKYLSKDSAEKINGKLIFCSGKSVILKLTYGTYRAEAVGAVPEPAQKRPLCREDLEKQIKKTGGSGFEFDRLEIEMDDGLFLPVQALKELRRNALESLKNMILDASGRAKRKELRADGEERARFKETDACKRAVSIPRNERKLTVCAADRKVLQIVLRYPEISAVYVDCGMYANRDEFLTESGEMIRRCHESGKECWYRMPWIFRDREVSYYSGEEIRRALELYDGVVLRSLEEYSFLKDNMPGISFAPDYQLYTWNEPARDFWRKAGAQFDTVPLELNAAEIRRRGCVGSEMVVYGRIPLMVSAQCQKKNSSGCSAKRDVLYLTDRKNKRFPVKCECSFCCNIIYNSAPLELLDYIEDIADMGAGRFRLEFTTESDKEVSDTIHAYVQLMFHGRKVPRELKEFTRGHYKRGVE